MTEPAAAVADHAAELDETSVHDETAVDDLLERGRVDVSSAQDAAHTASTNHKSVPDQHFQIEHSQLKCGL